MHVARISDCLPGFVRVLGCLCMITSCWSLSIIMITICCFRGEPFIALAVLLNAIPEAVREKVAKELAADFQFVSDKNLCSLLKRMCEWILLLPMTNLTRTIATWMDSIIDRLAGAFARLSSWWLNDRNHHCQHCSRSRLISMLKIGD